jgi:hypothetical protein
VTAAELLARETVAALARRGQLSAGALARWLVESGFATGASDDRLVPTRLGLSLAAALTKTELRAQA